MLVVSLSLSLSLSLAFRRFYPEIVICGNATQEKSPSLAHPTESLLGTHRRRCSRGENQQKHYHRCPHSPTIGGRITDTRLWPRHLRLNFDLPSCAGLTRTPGKSDSGRSIYVGTSHFVFRRPGGRLAVCPGSRFSDGRRWEPRHRGLGAENG